MKIWCLPLLFTLAILTGRTFSMVKLSDFCNGDTDCAAIANTECSWNRCKCRSGYYGVRGTTECSKVTIGTECSSAHLYKCFAIPYGVCDNKTWKCRCVRGYSVDDGGDTCTVSLSGFCRNNADCSTIDNSECRANKCKCLPGHYGHRGKKTCWAVFVGQGCSFYNIYNCFGIIGVGVCNMKTWKCMCRKGYTGVVGENTCTPIGTNDAYGQKPNNTPACTTDAECAAKIANQKCHPTTKTCYCPPGYGSSESSLNDCIEGQSTYKP